MVLPEIESRIVKSIKSNKTGVIDKNYPDEAVSEVLIKPVGRLMQILEILKHKKLSARFWTFHTA